MYSQDSFKMLWLKSMRSFHLHEPGCPAHCGCDGEGALVGDLLGRLGNESAQAPASQIKKADWGL